MMASYQTHRSFNRTRAAHNGTYVRYSALQVTAHNAGYERGWVSFETLQFVGVDEFDPS